MKQIFGKENSIDVALLNMRSWKHSYDATHLTYLSVIIPAVLNDVITKTDTKTSKKSAFDLLKSQVLLFREMIKSFA